MKIRNILKELKPEPQTTQTTIEVKGQMKFLILLFLLKAEWTFQGQFMKIYAAIQNISNQSERRERRNKLIDGLALLGLTLPLTMITLSFLRGKNLHNALVSY